MHWKTYWRLEKEDASLQQRWLMGVWRWLRRADQTKGA
jgi:hypothetical protein